MYICGLIYGSMTLYKLMFLLLACFNPCKDVDKGDDKAHIISNEQFLSYTKDSTKSTSQILDIALPGVLAFAVADTSTFYYGNNIIEDDSLFRLLLIGKFIDTQQVIAIEVNLKDTVINFFRIEHKAWKFIGSEKTNIPIYSIEFEDLDGDDKKEITTSTGRNMNGNLWKEVYIYSNKKDVIKYAGSFSTDYIVRKERKQIEERYEGSAYMDHSQTLYEWRQEQLVPIRQVILTHESPDAENGKLFFEYYHISTNGIGELKLKFREPYNDENKLQRKLWDEFFITP